MPGIGGRTWLRDGLREPTDDFGRGGGLFSPVFGEVPLDMAVTRGTTTAGTTGHGHLSHIREILLFDRSPDLLFIDAQAVTNRPWGPVEGVVGVTHQLDHVIQTLAGFRRC